MTIEQAKNLRNGQTIYHTEKKDSRGNPVKYKVTSVKTWKRNPDKVLVGLKYGMYNYEKVTHEYFHLITTGE